MEALNAWRRCGSCKKPIQYSGAYYWCGIASCKKTAYCSMSCFDDHIPIMRHKDAWAQELIAPEKPDSDTNASESRITTARLVIPKQNSKAEIPHDILVVASKLKEYIRVRSGLNTSANVLERLSDMIRLQCDKAMERAMEDRRKTVMDKDFYL